MGTTNIGIIGLSSAHTIERIVTQYGNHVYRLAYRMTGSNADAEDVLQTVFFKLFRHWVNISGSKHLKGWLSRTTTNASIDLLRARKSRTRIVDIDMIDQMPSNENQPQEHLENWELKEKINEGLALLPPRQLAALVLYDSEGLKGKEVARILKVSEAAVRSYVFEARKKMRAFLKPFIK